ncbi:hypothetical protein I4641_17550 [Waterburya agarophytonicola K14]|uniref:Uncharacterized protein n=1 Tax=Waterburya agarophytonicola KI4 TaxID=2874699 RepID=A0A964BTE2_9CYAN|nr:hypothetical protein [Waterburya agarophytonicola]MCC0178779.1 hypothetical protein [Waterburya agarophytonicola KI4]
MKKRFLLPLACSLLLVPTVANASATSILEVNNIKSNESGFILAGFLDSITDVKEGVESVRDTIDTTNETTTDTIDAAHGVNEGVGNSKKIVDGGGESQESEVIENTEVIETTEGQVENGSSF